MSFVNRPYIGLTAKTRQHIAAIFPDDQEIVADLLLKECGANLPFLENADPVRLERYRFAALRLSRGDLSKLDIVIELAKRDWRDLLVAAGFGEDTEAHLRWNPQLDGAQ